jgi:hypothetical protein
MNPDLYPDPANDDPRGGRRSYTIIVSGPDPQLAWEAVQDAAKAIACAIDDHVSPFDVDVIEGTFANPLSGDNVLGLGGGTDEDYEAAQRIPKADSVRDTCRHCGRSIVNDNGTWVDPEASGDDIMWRETCDSHDTFQADHEPKGATE